MVIGIPLFCFSFYKYEQIYLLEAIFEFFFNSVNLSRFKVDQIFTVYSFKHGEFISVEILKLTCIVPQLHAFLFYIFNSAGQHCNEIFRKTQVF
jgi:hypothetical protein